MRPPHGSIHEDKAPAAHHEAQTADAAVLPSYVHRAPPTQAAQQDAAPRAPPQPSVIDLSVSSSLSLDCKDDRSCSSTDSPHAIKQEVADRCICRPALQANISKRSFDGDLSTGINKRYAAFFSPAEFEKKVCAARYPEGRLYSEATRRPIACHIQLYCVT